jgi:hypothetical protein
MFRLSDGNPVNVDAGIENVIFVARPEVGVMEDIADTVKAMENGASSPASGQRAEFHILFVPHRDGKRQIWKSYITFHKLYL